MKLTIASIPFLLSVAHAAKNLRGLQNTCGVTSFSVYNPTNNAITPLNARTNADPSRLEARIRLDQYKDGKINVIANTGSPCGSKPIKCVKIKFAGTERKERAVPYAVYGDTTGGEIYTSRPKLTGWQTLEAWTYSDSDCTKDESGYFKVAVHVVPKSSVTINASTLKTVFASTTGPATAAASSNAIKASCVVFKSTMENVVYKLAYSTSNFKCSGTPVNGTPLRIDFDVSATYSLDDNIGPYDYGYDLPTKAAVDDTLSKTVTGVYSPGPGQPSFLDQLKSGVPTVNPYGKATAISLL